MHPLPGSIDKKLYNNMHMLSLYLHFVTARIVLVHFLLCASLLCCNLQLISIYGMFGKTKKDKYFKLIIKIRMAKLVACISTLDPFWTEKPMSLQ